MDGAIVFITDLADQVVALPLIAAIAFVLLAQGWPRGAGAWIGAAVLTFAAVLFAKLVFITCGFWLSGTGINSPSGHAASGALLGGGLAATFGAGRAATIIVALFVGALIGATRLYWEVHTLAEVAVGVVLGTLGGMMTHALAGVPVYRPRALGLIVAAIAVIATLHGRHLPAESAIRDLAGLFRLALPICQPTTRAFSAMAPPGPPT